jgi:FAD synthetase
MKVLAFGTFDTLHPGHEYYLKEAAKLGDELWVIVARDATVREIKHHEPKHNEIKRLSALNKYTFVDHAVLGDLHDPYALIVHAIKPDIIALGYDQVAFTDKLDNILSKHDMDHVRIQRIPPFNPEQYKSSLIQP